jgi:hypothetical protein
MTIQTPLLNLDQKFKILYIKSGNDAGIVEDSLEVWNLLKNLH